MSGIQTYIPAALEVTDRAVEKVQILKTEEENEDLKLRVYVTGGGCSGFQYGFSFEDAMAEDDTQVSRDGVTVLVDSLSFQYLAGSTVDYEVGLMGSRFLITNPNASTTCGCGASFSI
jgi:iron-sulfur cluster insertion protein